MVRVFSSRALRSPRQVAFQAAQQTSAVGIEVRVGPYRKSLLEGERPE